MTNETKIKKMLQAYEQAERFLDGTIESVLILDHPTKSNLTVVVFRLKGRFKPIVLPVDCTDEANNPLKLLELDQEE